MKAFSSSCEVFRVIFTKLGVGIRDVGSNPAPTSEPKTELRVSAYLHPRRDQRFELSVFQVRSTRKEARVTEVVNLKRSECRNVNVQQKRRGVYIPCGETP